MSITEQGRKMAETARRSVAQLGGPDVRGDKGGAPLGDLIAPYTDPTLEAIRLAQNLSGDKNRQRIASNEKRAVADLYDFASAIDAAGDAYEQALDVFEERSKGFIDRVRAVRIAVASEVNPTISALKDAAAFIRALEDQKAFALLSSLVALGKECTAAFGSDGLARLAESLLVLSERGPKAAPPA